MEISTINLANNVRVWGIMAQFGSALDRISLSYLKEKGFGDGRTRSVGCLGWIWGQWLLKTPPTEIQQQIEPFVDRGIEMQTLSTQFEKRPLHDLLLLHCAIFACSNSHIQRLAEQVVDSAGAKGHHPRDDGELYASAWSGMLKHFILGNRTKAEAEAEIIWKSHKDISFKASTKQLVAPWLKGDWDAFRKNQKKDFEKRWEQAKEHGAAQANGSERMVNLDGYSSVLQSWCWAHCGLALLARRQGIVVTTDPAWFPPHAIECVDALK